MFPANTPRPYEPPAAPSRRDPAAPQHLPRPGRHPATPVTGSPRHPRPGPPRSCHFPCPRAGNGPQVPAAPRPPRGRVSPARPWAGPDGAECWGSGGGRAGHGPSSCQRKREEGLGPALPSGEELGALPRGGSSPAEEGREGWRVGGMERCRPAPPAHPTRSVCPRRRPFGRALPGARPAPSAARGALRETSGVAPGASPGTPCCRGGGHRPPPSAAPVPRDPRLDVPSGLRQAGLVRSPDRRCERQPRAEKLAGPKPTMTAGVLLWLLAQGESVSECSPELAAVTAGVVDRCGSVSSQVTGDRTRGHSIKRCQ